MSCYALFQRLSLGAAWLLLALAWTPARAQTLNESTVKASFLLNFVKFTQSSRVRDTVVLCSVAAQPLNGQLAALQGRTLTNRTLEIRQSAVASDWRGCDLLWVSESDADRVDVILRALGDAPVLTVGDFPEFVYQGGMIGLRLEDGRVRFDVNLVSAARAGLTLNSQMVKLAGRVLQ